MSRKTALLLGLLAAAAAAGLGIWLARGAAGPEEGGAGAGPVTFPEPSFAPPADTVERSDFAGAEVCRSCHADQYRAWSGSTHGRAGGEAAPDLLIAPFDGTPIRFADAVVVPRGDGAGSYEFVVRQDGYEEVHYPVAGVVGGGHMLGGGTQGFFTPWVDGTLRFLPWDWSRQDGVWFCNTGNRTEEGWVPVDPGMRLADCGDWPPSRVQGTEARFTNCQQCHGSQIGLALDPGRGYATEFATLRVDCESCHGPAREHAEMARSGSLAEDGEIGIRSLANLPVDSSLALCLRCHGLKDVLREGYLPGRNLELHFALKFPVLGDWPYFPDARVRTFAYQATHLSSDCYLEGPMDCVSCHEPHGQGYWDVNRRPLDGPFDDGQCTACHAAKAQSPEDHTFHPDGSEGSRCVSCHMPYLQHPEVGPRVPFARSDHTIPVPRPAFDASLGVESACIQCHEDQSPAELQARAEAWWGELKPHRPLVAGLIHADTSGAAPGGRLAAARLLLRPAEDDPLAQFQGLARMLVDHLEPDLPGGPEGEVEARLRALAESRDVDVRSLALAALHWSGGEDPEIREYLAGRLSGEAGDEATRRRWAVALGFLGDRHRDEGSVGWSRTGYQKALEILPDDPRILQAQGLLRAELGDFVGASEALRRSLEVDPERPTGWLNLGIVRSGAGDPAGAARAFQRALALNPHEALAHFNLGNLHQRAGELERAAEAYRRAVEADPGLARAQFELARTLVRLERYREALTHARRAVEFDSDDPTARQMLRDLENALGGG
ncbi:MAG: tetratricopeptide repeat protein [Gemmatimonadetes bacterium]|nr:tetratricopeptide repeat protein [Gemmatimonadota bacterium]NIR78379.1 tetratricopeptide repeat protein [Gemmatimonadota bacterium]NIT86983.1 tetratricopeptide repeat protein [Gemmatimonadota bacterium]NIU30827.1 tetratricopeptide repeat protein [Gemmatimonadota bacterium]NIU35601.1 tetratricopeptide repeat protein [Gemmatimonadota bacterium]